MMAVPPAPVDGAVRTVRIWPACVVVVVGFTVPRVLLIVTAVPFGTSAPLAVRTTAVTNAVPWHCRDVGEVVTVICDGMLEVAIGVRVTVTVGVSVVEEQFSTAGADAAPAPAPSANVITNVPAVTQIKVPVRVTLVWGVVSVSSAAEHVPELATVPTIAVVRPVAVGATVHELQKPV
jgi:hypothetical protein